MNAEQIINKIKQGKVPKKELSAMLEAIAHAFNEGNHDKD